MPKLSTLTPICVCLHRHASYRYDSRALETADKRVQLVREITSGIKAIKFMSWEQSYLEQINRERYVETGYIRLSRIAQVISVTAGRCSPVLASCATFIFMGVSGMPMRADVIFASISAFQGKHFKVKVPCR